MHFSQGASVCRGWWGVRVCVGRCINVLLHVCVVASRILDIQLLAHEASVRETSSWNGNHPEYSKIPRQIKNCCKRQQHGAKNPHNRYQIYYFTHKSFDINAKSANCWPENGLKGLKKTEPKVCQECRDKQEEALTQLAHASEHTPLIIYRFPRSH